MPTMQQHPPNFQEPVIILGGGQLSRMLTQSALAMGVTPAVVCARADDPALLVGAKPQLGSDLDVRFLRQVFAADPRVTFENEFVDVAVIKEASAGTRAVFYPSLDSIFTLQDKLRQKQLLGACGIACSRYMALNTNEPRAELRRLAAEFPQGFVLKWSRLGYDGKGTWLGPTGALSSEQEHLASEFIQGAVKIGVDVFAEEKIVFTDEVAMVAARSQDGQVALYPLVLSEQVGGICKWVRGPAAHFGVSSHVEATAAATLVKLLGALEYVGVLACEFFLTLEQTLIVNELAPRVHNSGHFSQDAASVSQFDNHMRCVLGTAAQNPDTAPFFMMGNLIGPGGVDREYADVPTLAPLPEGVWVHWYGKKQLRVGRKMGHLNGVAASKAKFVELERSMRQWVADWELGLKKFN